MNIAVCDDEKLFLEEEKRLIQRYFDAEGQACKIDLFLSGEDLLATEKELKQYDIIFLDVNMGELDGVKVAEEIRRWNPNVYLVFVTAFIKYSTEGYKVDATRFIIKGEGNLETAMNECLTAICKKMKLTDWRHIFRFREGELELGAMDIVYISSYLRYLQFHLTGDRVVCTRTAKLDDVEQLLRGRGFLRVHKSFLVNRSYIRDIQRYEARLYTGETVPISKARYIAARNEFLAFKGGL